MNIKIILTLTLLFLLTLYGCVDTNISTSHTDVVYFTNDILFEETQITLQFAEAVCDLTHPAAEVAIGTPTNGLNNPDEIEIAHYVNTPDMSGAQFAYKYFDVYLYSYNDNTWHLYHNTGNYVRIICQINILID